MVSISYPRTVGQLQRLLDIYGHKIGSKYLICTDKETDMELGDEMSKKIEQYLKKIEEVLSAFKDTLKVIRLKDNSTIDGITQKVDVEELIRVLKVS